MWNFDFFNFQVRESPLPLNVPTPLPAPDHPPGGRERTWGTRGNLTSSGTIWMFWNELCLVYQRRLMIAASAINASNILNEQMWPRSHFASNSEVSIIFHPDQCIGNEVMTESTANSQDLLPMFIGEWLWNGSSTKDEYRMFVALWS